MWITNVKRKINHSKIFLEKYESKISILFFIIGFLIDNFTLDRIDSISNNLILLTWLLTAIIFIFLHNYGDYKEIKNSFIFKIYTFSPYVIQFAFGALFSGFVVYYTRSSTFFDSWPFFVILYFLFIANEKVRNQYEKFHFQISILYFAFISFLIFYLPIIFKEANVWIFGLSILVSLFLIVILIKIFFKIFYPLRKFKWKIIRNILFIIVIFLFFYQQKILPPVPLSAKNMEIYHYVKKVGDGRYLALKEEGRWYDFLKWKKEYNFNYGDRLYAFSSVFAPTDFRTEIKYIWYWKNPKTDKWEKVSQYNQKLIGGRDNGFRSWAITRHLKEGDWKVYLLSNEGSVIDRIDFHLNLFNNDKYIKLEKVEIK